MQNQNKVKQLLDYNKETGVFTWKENRRGKAKKGDTAGTMRKNGRTTISINGKIYPAHHLAILYTDGELPTGNVKHIDGNQANNARSNLAYKTLGETSTQKTMIDIY